MDGVSRTVILSKTFGHFLSTASTHFCIHLHACASLKMKLCVGLAVHALLLNLMFHSSHSDFLPDFTPTYNVGNCILWVRPVFTATVVVSDQKRYKSSTGRILIWSRCRGGMGLLYARVLGHGVQTLICDIINVSSAGAGVGFISKKRWKAKTMLKLTVRIWNLSQWHLGFLVFQWCLGLVYSPGNDL